MFNTLQKCIYTCDFLFTSEVGTSEVGWSETGLRVEGRVISVEYSNNIQGYIQSAGILV